MPDEVKKAIAYFNEQLRPFFADMGRLGVAVKITIEVRYTDGVDKFVLEPPPIIRSKTDDTNSH